MKLLFPIFMFCFQFVGTHVLYAQCQRIETLNFPYEKGLEMELRGKTVQYDEFNFPLKTKSYSVRYSVTENEQSGKGNTALFAVDNVLDNDTISRNFLSDLYLNAKGMAWKANKGKAKLTQAIALPLEEGKTWYTSYDNKKHKMTCTTVDSSITLYLGKVRAFGVMYEMVYNTDPRFEVHQEMAEYYNEYLGKIAFTVKQYGIERNTGRVFVFYTEEARLEYTNASPDAIKRALQTCI